MIRKMRTALPFGEHATVAVVDYAKAYSSCGISYTRVIELQHSGEHNGTLVATYEAYTSSHDKDKPGYNIHISRDGGATWSQVSTVREQAADIQSKWMPFLYELPSQVGNMPAGTLLLAACSIDPQLAENTALRLYRSHDVGQTWEQFATIATGGGLKTGVWEPFLLVLPDGRLACYYSDCTENAVHSQKIVMRISADAVDWGETIDLISLEDRLLRPGMVTIARMNNGRFIMTYEMCNEANPDCGNAVHYRFSTDGINWGNVTDPGIKLVTDIGAVPGSAPYIAYIPDHGENGLLLITSVFQVPGETRANVVYCNDCLGNEKAWRAWFQPVEYTAPKGGYSHAIFVGADGKTVYFVNNVPDANSAQGYYKMIFLRIQSSQIQLTQRGKG